MSTTRSTRFESISTTPSQLPKLYYDPIKKRSNIYDMEPLLDSYVQQHFLTLYDCISSKCLTKIRAPNFSSYGPVANPPVATALPQAQEADADEENGNETESEEDANANDEYDPSSSEEEEEDDDVQTPSTMPQEFAMKRSTTETTFQETSFESTSCQSFSVY